jgi:alpha-tubulin suppressor-like RCC1 family protein
MNRAWILGLAAITACSSDITPIDVAGPPANVTAGSSISFSGGAGQALSSPLTVVVTDADGKPTPAIPVVWAVKRGALGSHADSTDNDGVASAAWVLPTSPGVDTVVAAVAGVGAIVFSATVGPLEGDIVFRYIDAGSYHVCGIATTEQLLCWGYNGDGQLGLNSTSPFPFPQLIPGDLRFRLVTGGQYHSCGVTLAGVGYCWGNNVDGRLGNGGGLATVLPAPVSTPVTFQALQAGRLHSCGVDLAQHVWCWGYDGDGEAGVPGFQPGSVVDDPTVVVGDPAVRTVATGGQHTCAVTVGGAVVCWGYNVAGQLGDGTAGPSRANPVAVGLNARTDPAVIFPSPDPDFPLPPGPFLAAGYDHTCAISSGGPTACWGLNQDGQLGDGTVAQRNAPTTVAGGHTFAAVTAGFRHTCALDTNGAAWCWGSNTFGQLGDGTTTSAQTPVAVSGGLTFAYIKAGDLSTCGITSAGVAYCWGDNEYGQLGVGDTEPSSVPVKVAFQP